MKKVFVLAALSLLLFTQASVSAADFQKNLTFAWEQTATDLPNLAKWRLHVRGAAGGPDLTVIDVPYSSGAGPTFTSAQSFTVTGAPGATVRRYFVMDAVSKGNEASGFSNETFYDFLIPFPGVSAPFGLTVNATVSPQ
jgi:hypothetical protein